MEQEVLPPQQQLIQAREQALWTVERVAAALNLSLRSVQLLEAGDFRALHGTIYVVSYIKAYAALFSLDGVALVAEYRKLCAEPVEVIERAKPVAKFSSDHQRYRTVYGLFAAAAIIAAVGLLSVKPAEQKTADDVFASHFSTSEEIIVDTAAGTTTISSLDVLRGNNPTAGVLAQTQVQSLPLVDTAEQIKQRALGLDSTAIVAPSSSLNFKFSADCWVEVYDGDNKQIFSSLQRAQEQLELSGKPPFRITLGYAPGVSLSYNGQPIEINAKNAKFTKLVLGNS